MKEKVFLIFFILLLVIAPAVAGEEENGVLDLNNQNGVINIDADDYFISLKDRVHILTGSVKVLFQDMVITSEKAEYNELEEEILFEEDVLVVQGENQIKSPRMWLDVAQEHIIFSDGVEATYYHVEEGEGEGEEETHPINIWADTIEIWNLEEELQARDNVKVVYQEFTLTADEAFMDQKNNILTISGNVYVERDDGSWFKCEKAVYDLEKETLKAYRIESEFKMPAGEE